MYVDGSQYEMGLQWGTDPANGVYAVSFSFPVVPKGEARIRVQLSAGHTREQVDHAIAAFTKVGKKMKIVS